MSTPRKGVFISFEGGEATGKTTQIAMLSQFLHHSAIPHIVTREPGGCPQGEVIRNLLLDPNLPGWSVWSQYLLLLADRNEHINSVILPALAEGKWVLCDRFQDSSRVYQGIVGGLGIDVVDEIYTKTMGDVWPNLTFVLEISEDEMLQRLDSRTKEKDRFDQAIEDLDNISDEDWDKAQSKGIDEEKNAKAIKEFYAHLESEQSEDIIYRQKENKFFQDMLDRNPPEEVASEIRKIMDKL
jgi:dTMP kinase